MGFFKCARSARMLNLRWIGHQSHDPLVARLPNGDPKLYHLSQSRTPFCVNSTWFFFRQMLELFLCIKFGWRLLPGSYRSWMKKTESYGSLSLKFQDTEQSCQTLNFQWIPKNKSLNSLSICQLLAQEFVSHKIPFSTVSLGQMLGCSGTSRVVPILTSLRRERPCGRKIGIEPFCDKMLTSEDSRFMVLYILLCYCSNSVAIQRILMYSAHFSDNLVSPCSGLNCFLAWWFFELVSPYRISDSRLEQACRSITRGRSQGFLSEKRSLLVVSCCRSWNCFSHISVPGSSWNYFAMIVMLQSYVVLFRVYLIWWF